MAKELFNEAEQYLLTDWREAVQVEETLGSIRDKYKDLIQQVVDMAQERYPQLDTSGVWVTQRWTVGQFGIGRKVWGGKEGWPVGIWFWCMRLEKLLSEEDEQEDFPVAHLGLGDGRNPPVDRDVVRARIREVAPKILTNEESAAADMTEYDSRSFCQFALPPRSELLAMLRNGNGERFKTCLMAKIDVLAKFIPVLDELYVQKARA